MRQSGRHGGRSQVAEAAYEGPLLIVLGALVLAAGSGLAIINKACRTSHHGWCAPVSDVRNHVKTRHS